MKIVEHIKKDVMKPYRDLLQLVLDKGNSRGDRTGTGTTSIFGYQMRFNLQDGFPLVTTKKIYTRSLIHELIWFLSGDTNAKYLQDNKVKIWDSWIREDNTIGDGYGKQWRAWKSANGETIDQIAKVIEAIKTNPNSRRHMVSAWNVGEIDNMALPPCHSLFQFYVEGNKLSLQLYQRSGDLFLGVPFNIASYALLLHMVAQVTGLEAYEFIHTLGDAHIYNNHIEQVTEQLSREPFEAPILLLNQNIKEIDGFGYDDIVIVGYEHHPAIKGEVSV